MILHSSIAQRIVYSNVFGPCCVNVQYSSQHNSKVGRKYFDNFDYLKQTETNIS